MLYKGKYIIAFYDNDDYPVFVVDNIKELKEALVNFNKKEYYDITRYLSKYLSKILHGEIEDSHLKLIDILEEHDDIFSEEDKLFIDFIEKTCPSPAEEAKRLGISLRTYYRNKQQNKRDSENEEKRFN